jgi:recombination protein RecA
LALKTQDWLDTRVPDLNEALGDRERGIPYGRIIEISGKESQGKSALALTLAALAQRDGAGIVWLDFESSYDPTWAQKRGIEHESDGILGGFLIQPYLGTFGKEKVERLATAEILCAEAESAMVALSKNFKKQILICDSVASMLTEDEAGAGIEGGNMRTRMGLPMFLSSLLRRWVGLVQSCNVLVLFINQLREDPMARYGDKLYTPGGKSLPYYAHVRVRMRRSGKMLLKGKPYGIQGIISNTKNKAGGVEKSKVGYQLHFDGPLHFLPAKEVEKLTNKTLSEDE